MTKHLVRSADYRSRASQAAALAEASVLDRVRERHEAAASAWMDLAEHEDHQALLLGRRLDRAAEDRSAAERARPGGEPGGDKSP